MVGKWVGQEGGVIAIWLFPVNQFFNEMIKVRCVYLFNFNLQGIFDFMSGTVVKSDER